jgi:GAF domain-containing protein
VTAEDRLALLVLASRMLAATSHDLTAALEALARIVVPRLADDCVVFVIEGHAGIRRVAEASVSDENAAVLRKLRENPPAFGASNAVLSAVRGGKTVVVDHVDERALANLAGGAEHAAALRAVNPTTFVSVPLFGSGDDVVGAFTFGVSISARTYTPDDVALAEELGRRAGMAVANARLFRDATDAQRRADVAEQRMARLQFTTAAFGRVTSPSDAGMTALENLVGMFGAEAGVVYLRAAEEMQPLAWIRRLATPSLPFAEEFPIAYVTDIAEPLYLQDREELVARFPMAQQGVPGPLQAAIVLPLVIDAQVMGAIALNFAMPRMFFPDDRQFAEAMAAQAAIAIDRARLRARFTV